MLPIGDDNSGERTFPIVTYALIALNVLFFLVELSGGDAFVKQWAFVPSRFLADPSADFPTLFTSMFMHGGWVHLGGNMLYLWIFGDNVEDRLGHGMFLVFYLICGLAATFAQLIVNPDRTCPTWAHRARSPACSAPTSCCSRRAGSGCCRGRQVVQMPALMVIGFWIVLQLFSGIGSIANAADTGGVAYMAHVGGFLAGCVLTVALRGRRAATV